MQLRSIRPKAHTFIILPCTSSLCYTIYKNKCHLFSVTFLYIKMVSSFFNSVLSRSRSLEKNDRINSMCNVWIYRHLRCETIQEAWHNLSQLFFWLMIFFHLFPIITLMTATWLRKLLKFSWQYLHKKQTKKKQQFHNFVKSLHIMSYQF